MSRICPTHRRMPPLPDAVVVGAEPFLIVGAMAGGSIAAGLMPLDDGHCHHGCLTQQVWFA